MEYGNTKRKKKGLFHPCKQVSDPEFQILKVNGRGRSTAEGKSQGGGKRPLKPAQEWH